MSAPADGALAVACDAEPEAPTRRHLPVVSARRGGPKDITGQRFGTLTAVEYTHTAGNGMAHWRVRCDCGAARVVSGGKLRGGTLRCLVCHQATRPPPKGRRPYVHRTEPRSITLNARRTRLTELRAGMIEYPPEEHALYERPVTRGDCLAGGINEARPCPWVSCVHHLAIDVNEDTGGLKITFPSTDVAEMGETCALDVADRDPQTLESIAEAMNITRERVRMIEEETLATLRRTADALAGDAADEVDVARAAPTWLRGDR